MEGDEVGAETRARGHVGHTVGAAATVMGARVPPRCQWSGNRNRGGRPRRSLRRRPSWPRRPRAPTAPPRCSRPLPGRSTGTSSAGGAARRGAVNSSTGA
eukprot:5058403-Prymnesium_polylepis.1